MDKRPLHGIGQGAEAESAGAGNTGSSLEPGDNSAPPGQPVTKGDGSHSIGSGDVAAGGVGDAAAPGEPEGGSSGDNAQADGGAGTAGGDSVGVDVSRRDASSSGSDSDSGSGERCGNGALDEGELCDPGLQACCNEACDSVRPDGFRCRVADGDCDVAEYCDGEAPACPADAVAGSELRCREQQGPCDGAEHCDGVHKRCPDDAVAAVGTVCRAAAPDHGCDVEERCDGDSKGCPEDRVEDQGTVCRASLDACDATEVCDGQSRDCPIDALDACTNVVIPAGLPQTLTTNTDEGCAEFSTYTCDEYGALGEDAPETNFLFTAPERGLYAFDTIGSTFDTGLYIFDTAACSANQLGCNDNRADGEAASLLVVELEAGITVPVTLDGVLGESGEATLNVQQVRAPGSCSAPRVLQPGATSTLLEFTHLALDQVSASCGAHDSGVSSPEAVFRLTAPEAGAYRITTLGSSFDTVLAAFGDGCDGEELACSDNMPGSTASELLVELDPGQSVYLAVEAYGVDPLVGAVQLNVFAP